MGRLGQRQSPSKCVALVEETYSRWFTFKGGFESGPQISAANKYSDESVNQVVWLRNIDKLIHMIN